MPVDMKASPELMPTREQREYIYHRIREVRGFTGGKEIFVMDFQNDGSMLAMYRRRKLLPHQRRGDVEAMYLFTIQEQISVRSLC